MTGGALLGGTLGGVAGGAVGAAVIAGEILPCSEILCVVPIAAGVVLGEAIGVPLGAHSAGGAAGNVWLSTAASVAIAAAGATAAVMWESPYPLLAIPIAQIPISIGIEYGTAQRR